MLIVVFSLSSVCVCVCSFRKLVNSPGCHDLPCSRLIGWEGCVSLFVLVNERKEGEPIQYTHILSTEGHCQGSVCYINVQVVSGCFFQWYLGMCMSVCVCVCVVLRVTALNLTSHLRLISSCSLSKHKAN